MAIVEFSVTPLGIAGTGVSQYVAACVKVVEQSGLNFQLTSKGTICMSKVRRNTKGIRSNGKG